MAQILFSVSLCLCGRIIFSIIRMLLDSDFAAIALGRYGQ